MKWCFTRSNPAARWLQILILMLIQFPVIAQETASLTGTVLNEKGDAMPGVTVLAASSKGNERFTTLTNERGVFTFQQLKVGSTYSFTSSSVGYQDNVVASFTVKSGSNSLLVKLASSNNVLDQVVVIGYGTQKRETVTGAISTVTAKDFNSGQINDPLTLIAGKVPGLSLSNSNRADPNATADFQLRGPATVTGNSQPLVVIDGVPGGDLQTIAPNDIASIDILKDGSAAAIYGSRATAGVIIITTKKGRVGAVKVNYSGYVTTSSIAKKYDVLNAQQYLALGKTLQAADSTIVIDNQGGNTDWFDAVTRTPFSHSHNLSVSGGNEKTNYYASINYRNFQGIDLRSKREFVNGTFRLNTKALNDKLDFGLTIANSFDTKSFANYGAIAQSLNIYPTYPVYNQDGSFFQHDVLYFLQWNPVANIYQNTYNTKEKRFLGTATAAYHILPSLTAAATYSLTKNDILNGSFSNIDDYFQVKYGTNGQASQSNYNTTNNVLEATLAYDKQVGDHHLNAIAGYSYQDIFNENFGAGNNNFTTNAYGYYNIGAGSALFSTDPNANRSGIYSIGSHADERTLLAYFGRVIYDYKQKYLLNVSIRREGASVLGDNNKWGNFPGVSAGWIMSKENFLAGSDVVKFLKLRAGYGVTGNQESLVPYQSLARVGVPIGSSQSGYIGGTTGGTWVTAYGPTSNANPLLEWETKTETNIGLDFSFFNNNWLSGSLDVYDRRIRHLINSYSAQQPSQIYPYIYANAGTMQNRGIELLLNAKLVSSKTFNWNVSATGAYNKNKILSVTSNQFFGSAQDITRVSENVTIQRIAPGQPMAVFYGLQFAGITKDGQWQFKKKDGSIAGQDGVDPSDYQYLGNSMPKYTFGLTNTLSIGHLDINLLLKGAAGFHAVNAKRMFHENRSFYGRSNLFTSALNTNLNDVVKFSSYYVEDASYMKIENLNIAYTIPFKNSKTVQSLQFYITGANLLTISGFSGTDPELQLTYYGASSDSETDSGPGLEQNYSYYPNVRSYTLGVNVNF